MPKIVSVPTIDEFRPVVLRVLNDGQARPVKEIAHLAADYLKLPEEVTSQILPSGNQSRVTNLVNWACSSFFVRRLGYTSKTWLVSDYRRWTYR